MIRPIVEREKPRQQVALDFHKRFVAHSHIQSMKAAAVSKQGVGGPNQKMSEQRVVLYHRMDDMIGIDKFEIEIEIDIVVVMVIVSW